MASSFDKSTEIMLENSFSSTTKEVNISHNLFEKIHAFCELHNITISALIQFAFHKVLRVYQYSDQILNYDSTNEKFRNIILRDTGIETCIDGVKSLQDQFENNEPSLPNLKTDALFVYAIENFKDDISYKSEFEIVLKAIENLNTISLSLRMNQDHCQGKGMEYWLEGLTTAIENIIRNPNQLISKLECVPKIHIEKFNEWNKKTDGSFPDTIRLDQLIQEAAKNTPDKIAVVFENIRLTYKELNERANQLARYLLQQGTGQMVALMLEKDETLVTTILGIWKSGAAWVPIDASFPNERVKFILNDSKASILLTNQKYQSKVDNSLNNVKLICVESIQSEVLLQETQNLNVTTSNKDLAYLLYTSGTTGLPKGVAKEHRGVVNSITDLSNIYKMKESDLENVALFSPYVFEPFVRQLLIPLVNSQTLVIVPEELKTTPDKFEEFLVNNKISYLNGTPSLLELYDYSKCKDLKRILVVGEELTTRRFMALRASFHGTIISEYGFTEAALVSLVKEFEPSVEKEDGNIGRPLRNVKCYILDEHMQRVPIGAVGEIYIGGYGIARGYFNRPELTAEKFLPNPFQTKFEVDSNKNSTIYKSGDLGRWLPNGEIEYLGRNDFQIKLNGVRIEPKEIESIISTYPDVAQCIMVGRTGNKDKSDHTMGYYVSKSGGPISEEDLFKHLELKLPQYMIPRQLVQLDKMPLNLSGKVDLNALKYQSESVEKILEPRNELDKILLKIWIEVLGEKNIDISADFFRLGGNSVSCIQLIASIRKEIGISVGVDAIFSARTISKLSDKIQETGQLVHRDDIKLTQIGTNSDTSRYPANSLQQGLMYHYLKQKNDDAYVVQNVYSYKSKMDIEKYKAAWELALQSYPALRLQFPPTSDMVQVVSHEKNLCWYYYDVQSGETSIKEILQIDRGKKYNLESGQLFRIYLIRENEEKYWLIFSFHHIILDGWSIPLITSFVHNTYLKSLNGIAFDLELDRSYGVAQDYLFQHRLEHIDYWREEVNSITQRCNLESLLKEEKRYIERLSDYDRVEQSMETMVQIPATTVEKIKNTYAKEGITLHSILQFVWHRVLHAYGQGVDTVVGTTLSGRNIPIEGVETSVGLYINTLPLILHHDDEFRNKTLLEAISGIQRQVNKMNDKSNMSLGSIQSGEMKHTLFDSLFVLENYPEAQEGAAMNSMSLGFKLEEEHEKLDYPLGVVVKENTSGLAFALRFAGELFDSSRVTSMMELVKHLLSQIADLPPNTLVKSIDFLLPSELKLFDTWNRIGDEFPESTLSEVFETMVAQHPNNLAVVYEKVKITYEKLNLKCNGFARYLLQLYPLKPNNVVGLLLDKNENMIISILSVWKTGGAFVPVDASYPDERIKFILGDTEANIVITNEKYVKRLQVLLPGIIVISVENILEEIEVNEENLGALCSNRDPAYVIYTSGTTGTPKGVMVEHRGVVNLMTSLYKLFGLRDSPEVILSFSNYVFDHFYEQMLDALFNGQTLVVLNDEMRTDERRLREYIAENNVTYLSGTPSVLSMYNYLGLSSLKRIDGVGEDFTSALYQKIRSTFNGLIINGYGPTEISITSHKRLYPFGEQRTNKSIGTQIHNTATYVLDKDLNMVPIGAVGEMYIGGVGVARGYLNRPDLSKDRFVQNPFSTNKDNSRMYKTGDLVRLLANGEVEYLGRNDSQVKIRGQRIEVSEIEAVILSHPTVEHAVVVLEPGKRYLVGYYVNTKNSTLDEINLKTFIVPKLPTYMIPARLVQIPAIPVTISGKVDTKRLPEAELISTSNKYLPSNEIEEKLCLIWTELLSEDNIGTRDDFMSLGGDSLLAVSLSFMVSKSFGRTLTVADVFKLRTVECMAQHISRSIASIQEIQHRNKVQGPLSLAQERILFINELEGSTNAFNISLNLKISNTFDSTIVHKAVIQLVKRHEILRTIYPMFGNERVQIVLPMEDVYKQFELAQFKVVQNQDEIDKTMRKESEHFFKLDTELPIKVLLLSCSNCKYICITFHHISFDEWSLQIFYKELESLLNKFEVQLKELPTTYLDYSIWQRENLHSLCSNSIGSYWKEKLGNVQPLQLITDFTRPINIDYNGATKSLILSKNISLNLISVARQLKVSFFSLLSSAFALLLSTYSSQEEILIGTPVTSRNHQEIENVVGFFVNLIVLKVSVDQNLSVANYIRLVGEEVVQSTINSQMPFEKVVKTLEAEKDLSRHPVFQVLFALVSADEPTETDQTLLSKYQISSEFTPAKYDLSVSAKETNDGLHVSFNWATALYNETTIERFMSTYSTILELFSHTDVLEQKIDELHFTPDKYQNELDVTDTSQQVPEFETVLETFNQSVRNSPDDIALVFENIQLTYAELDKRSNELAQLLTSNCPSIGSDDLVAVFLNKSDFMIITILAIWKAGGAYVPIDPEAPKERIKYILEDTKPAAIVTLSKLKNQILEICGDEAVVVVADDSFKPDFHTSALPVDYYTPLQVPKGKDLAYVIYTSGTTGKPKGVMIQHGGLQEFRSRLNNMYMNSKDKEGILFLSNYIFDFSIEQLLLSIFSGNKLIIPPSNYVLDSFFYTYCNGHGLSYLSGTPTFIHRMDLSQLTNVKTVTVAGEFFTQTHFEKIRKHYNGRLNNAYGVTETTIYNMVDEFKPDDEYRNSLGKVIPNTKAYILNKCLKPVPHGAIGELYLAGNCVGRGYLNRPTLTAEAFLPNPFEQTGKFSRMYRTGDLVRRNFKSQIEYIGRKDKQVKIRGFRIELDEVGSVLAKFPGMTEVAVVPAQETIVAYYVHDSGKPLTESELTNFIESKLPSYMIPSKFIFLSQLPLTPNGKLDERMLPVVGTSQESTYAPPRNAIEANICQKISKLLNLAQGSRVGIDDNFFHIGGDSILALLLVGQVQDANTRINVRNIFELKTVRNMAEHIARGSNTPDKAAIAEQGILGGPEFPLSPIQQWFFQKNISNPHHWNQSFSILTPILEIQRLKLALEALYEHHDALRLRFSSIRSNASQVFAHKEEINFHVLDVSKTINVPNILAQLQTSFDLQTGPASVVVYLHGYDDGYARIWLAIHHLLVDTVSWRILCRDLEIFYTNTDLKMLKTSSYRQWVNACKQYQPDEDERKYWSKILENFASYNNEVKLNPTTMTSSLSWQLDEKRTGSILASPFTPNVLLLSAVNMSLQKEVTGSIVNYVTLEGHGREECVADDLNLTNTVGWFTSMYPVELEAKSDTLTTLQNLKKSLESIPNNGVGYGLLFSYINNPLPNITFNYLGQMDASMSNSEWSLESVQLDYSSDRCTETKSNRNKNAILDITAWCVKGELNIHVESNLGNEKMYKFLEAFKKSVEDIISCVGSSDKIVSQQPIFEPYYKFPALKNNSGVENNIFIFPPGEGGAESYFNNLLPNLQQSFTLLLFNNVYLHRRYPTSFEELAEYYLKYIKQIQPTGPYNFVGWSFGGVLSFEITRKIEEMGEDVQSLVMIDSYFNVNKAYEDTNLVGIDVLDKINTSYKPNVTSLRCDNVFLFKAELLNDMFKNENEKKLYAYYLHTHSNNLNTILDKNNFQIIYMLTDTHSSWVKNENQVECLCSTIKNSVNK